MINEKSSSNIHRTSVNSSISQLTDLSWDIIRDIFDYLPLGDIYFSFYHINNSFKTFIDNQFSCLNLTSMSHGQFVFYYQRILSNNIEHCQKINSLILSNNKPFDHIATFFSIIHFYTNLKRLHLYFPNSNQLNILPSILPNLCEIYIILKSAKSTDLKWLSSLKKLEICSIESEIHGIEIDNSLRSFSSSLSSITIPLSFTYDFDAILTKLPADALRYLNISLSDDEFCYTKTSRSSISLAQELIHFSFDMSLKWMKSASSLYDILRFVASTLRHVQTLTILCRFTDGIVVDEKEFRGYLSSLYSVNEYKLFIEMNNLPASTKDQPTFDEKAYTYPFWVEKGVRVNIYRNKYSEIKRVRIYTLPLVSKVVNFPNHSEDTYKLVKSSSSNIAQFTSQDSTYNFADDLTLTPNRIHFSSNIVLLLHLPNISSFVMTEEDMPSFLRIVSGSKTFPNIRKLQLRYLPSSLMKNVDQLFRTFPCIQSLSINKVDDFDLFGSILDTFLLVSSTNHTLIHLCIVGLYFDSICPAKLNEEQLKTNFNLSDMNSNSNYSQFIEHSFRRLTLLIHQQDNPDLSTSMSVKNPIGQSTNRPSLISDKEINLSNDHLESFSFKMRSCSQSMNNESTNASKTRVKIEPMARVHRTYTRPPKNRTSISYRCPSAQLSDRSETSLNHSFQSPCSPSVTEEQSNELPIHIPHEQTLYDVRFERDRQNDVRQRHNIPPPFQRKWLRQPRYVPQERPNISQTPQSPTS